jgi:hypothetical protein
MINPDIQQVFEISDCFHQLAKAVEIYIGHNKIILRNDEINDLYDKQIELLRISGEINAVGVALVFEDAKQLAEQLENITREVTKTANKALMVQDAIDLTTSLVGIGTAIVSKDPKAIADNAGKAVNIVRAIKNKKEGQKK